MNSSQAASAARIAINHPSWVAAIQPDRIVIGRQEILQALSTCASRLSAKNATKLALAALPLTDERKQDFDYGDAMELLCQLASSGDKALRSRLKKALFPPKKPLNAIELQVRYIFGAEEPLKGLDESAHRIAANIRLQVQRLPENVEPLKVNGCLFTINSTTNGQSTVVTMVQPTDISAILQHRKHLSRTAINELVDAMLCMIEDTENILANKFSLVDFMEEAAEVCQPATLKRIASKLTPLARGTFSEPTITMTAEEAKSPLNPWKMASGNPSEVRGKAIQVLAKLEHMKKGTVGLGALNAIIRDSAIDPEWYVRYMSFSAARELETIDDATLSIILFGTRDRDARVAYMALNAIIGASNKTFKKVSVPLILHALSEATREADPAYRRGAAHALNKLIPRLSKPVANSAKTMLEQLRTDKCFSVRFEAGKYQSARRR